ncbi:helix-turn-helix domain-containing protein [Mucilaginibacter sp. E4BP6]|uniref:helix-turn-helix domain-containing protein n=1 Tax=Mucilaginibacter sp. E4BP6 TaxID=2723089 RepID=UPI0015CD33BB|nr:helix-turn-helix domain-containing protein [Mucilaginibacter sp. E4BP6]NYE67386.1 AraC-like DNA-binding protein [Mucilaginibacter sp. E4BP6]
MILFIKNMVGVSCKVISQMELEKLGLKCISVEIGRIEISESVSPEYLQKIKAAFLIFGLEVIDTKKEILVEKIKHVIIEMIHHTDDRLKMNFSNYLSEKLNYDYTYLSNTFVEEEGITIEYFIILHRIDRVKALIVYNELTLTEISWKLHYSSVAHLSAQFKKITGVTPSYFKTRSPICA